MPFTPITGSTGVPNMAYSKCSVSVLSGGSGVFQVYGPPPVNREKSHPYLPFNCLLFLRRGRATEGADQRVHFTRVHFVFRVLPFNLFFSRSLSSVTNQIKKVVIFVLVAPNHKCGIHMFA